MARDRAPGSDAIYAIHRRWIIDVLGPGDSLLTPGTPIWAQENLDELQTTFVEQPDTRTDKGFLEKLHDQLAHVSAGAVQLMAELHVVHFLVMWNGAISAAKKRRDIEAILSWMPQPCSIPNDIASALSPGIVNPGQWVLTHRDTQLRWLIGFSRAWKDLPGEQRDEMLTDPWAFKAFAQPMTTSASNGAMLALLHLTHPDTFEAIVSAQHKKDIVTRFKELVDNETDIDRQLLAVRASLAREYGADFEWHSDPLVHRWHKDPKAWPGFLTWLQRFRALPDFEEQERTYKLRLAEKLGQARHLLARGDDQWHNTLHDAFTDPTNNIAQWQSYQRFLTWLKDEPQAAGKALLPLWTGDLLTRERLTTFFDALPATVLGTLGARLNIASFLLMADDATKFPPAKIMAFRSAWTLAGWGKDKDLDATRVYERVLVFLDELVRDGAGWPAPLRDRLDAQGAIWALTKADEKPASWSDEWWKAFLTYRSSATPETTDDEGAELGDPGGQGDAEEPGPDETVDHIAAAAHDLHIDRDVLDEIIELLDDKGQVVLYGPPGTGKTYLALRLARAIVDGDEDRLSIVQFHPATSYEYFFEGLRPRVTDAGNVTYERTDGPLVALVDKAAADPLQRKHVMVIDEINRANLPKVLGELLFLLEYRQEGSYTLYRPKNLFKLPPNLWLIGTMNTADRSIALVDAAMRRRFHFVPFFPHEGAMKDLLRRWLKDGGGRAAIADFLDAVNAELIEQVGEHLLVGPSHFMRSDLSERALERIWTYNVFPLLEEQLWGNRAEIDRWRWHRVRQRFATQLSFAATSQDAGPGNSGEAPVT